MSRTKTFDRLNKEMKGIAEDISYEKIPDEQMMDYLNENYPDMDESEKEKIIKGAKELNTLPTITV